MLVAIALAMLAGQVTVNGGPPDGIVPKEGSLPSSFRRDVLRSCAPVALDAAEECLRRSMNADDAAILADRIPARRFRGYIDCEIELAWKLDDPASPMARLMDGLIGAHNPSASAGMIISDLQSRAAGGGSIDFENMREAFKENPSLLDGPSSTCNPSTKPSV